MEFIIEQKDATFISKVNDKFKNIASKYMMDLYRGICLPLEPSPKLIGRVMGIINRKELDRLRGLLSTLLDNNTVCIVDAPLVYRLLNKEKKSVTRYLFDNTKGLIVELDNGTQEIPISIVSIPDVNESITNYTHFNYESLISLLDQEGHTLNPYEVSVIAEDMLTKEIDGVIVRLSKQSVIDISAKSSVKIYVLPYEEEDEIVRIVLSHTKEIINVLFIYEVIRF